MRTVGGIKCSSSILFQAAKSQVEVDKLMKALDHNGDSEVDFNEFVVLVAAMTCACHDLCHKK